MTKVKPNWRALFLEARKIIEIEVDRHSVCCGCQDVDDAIEKGGVVEGKCHGLQEQQDFLAKTTALSQEGKVSDA